jgi:hypothetical protein
MIGFVVAMIRYQRGVFGRTELVIRRLSVRFSVEPAGGPETACLKRLRELVHVHLTQQAGWYRGESHHTVRSIVLVKRL